MAEMKERVRRELTAAMKSRDALRAGTLRMVLAALTNAEVAVRQARELSDEDVVDVIKSESRKRREVAEAFEAAWRQDRADTERA